MGRPRVYATRAAKDAAYYRRKKQRLAARPRPQLPPLPPGPYRVLYADVPWHDFNLNPYLGLPVSEAPWTLETLCALPVKALRASTQALLFLWTPPALLLQGLQVLAAWGFRYRDHLIWDHSQRVYAAIGHDVLLIGSSGRTRYSSTVHLPSVISIVGMGERKPEAFRERIDACYPFGSRLELFAPYLVDGWDAWPFPGEEAPSDSVLLDVEYQYLLPEGHP
jgi:N6-adenosine-specific RNA methylase IME4